MIYSISLSTNDITFPAIINSDYAGITITVTTNNNEDSDCYYIMTDIDWATFERNGGTVRIIPTSNVSNFMREGFAIFYNKGDNNVFATLNITQDYIEYSVNAYKEKIILLSIPEDKRGYEEIEIDITVRGGRKSFYVNTINEYTKTDNTRLSYDKAFHIRYERTNIGNEENTYKMYIKSYGIITVDTKYEIVLSHSDRRDVQKKIMVEFGNIDTEVPVIEHKEFLYCETREGNS